jgi:hypothetical protein
MEGSNVSVMKEGWGVILADSELQYGKEGPGLEPNQRDLIVYHEQPFSEPTVEDVQLAICDKFIHVGCWY